MNNSQKKVFRSVLLHLSNLILVNLLKTSMLNFDSNPRDRNEVQKNKWTLVYQTDLNGES
jgi:hypothetical protein